MDKDFLIFYPLLFILYDLRHLRITFFFSAG